MTVVEPRGRGAGLSRGQHFIPRMHLAGFKPEARPHLLARFDKSTGGISRVSVQRAAVQNDYYTLPTETGHAPDALEQQFSGLERVVAPWIRTLRAVSSPGLMPLDPIARDGLAGYLAMLHVRSPAFREPARRLDTYLASIRADMTLADPEGYLAQSQARGDIRAAAEIEAERVRDLARFRSGELFLEAPEVSSLKHLKLAIDQFRPRLMSKAWSVVRRDRPPYLLLGDQPVVLVGPGGELGEIGFVSPDVDVLAPLSPTALLVMTDEPHINGVRIHAPDSRPPSFGMPWWQIANESAWRTAERFVHARSPMDLEATELSIEPAERRSTLPGPAVSGGPSAWEAYARRLGIRTVFEDLTDL